MLGTRYSGAALAKVRGRGLDCKGGVSRPHEGDGLSGSLPVLAGGGGPCVTSGDVA